MRRQGGERRAGAGVAWRGSSRGRKKRAGSVSVCRHEGRVNKVAAVGTLRAREGIREGEARAEPRPPGTSGRPVRTPTGVGRFTDTPGFVLLAALRARGSTGRGREPR